MGFSCGLRPIEFHPTPPGTPRWAGLTTVARGSGSASALVDRWNGKDWLLSEPLVLPNGDAVPLAGLARLTTRMRISRQLSPWAISAGWFGMS